MSIASATRLYRENQGHVKDREIFMAVSNKFLSSLKEFGWLVVLGLTVF